MELTDVQLCTHGLIKLSKTGGLYTKATERWNLKDLQERQQWMEFKSHYIEEYEKMLAANGGNTKGQEGYSNASAYQAIEDVGSSLAHSIVQYAERATTAEAQVSDLESRLAALEMENQNPPPHMGYFSPQTAYGMIPGGPPPPATINVPPTYHNTQQQTGGKETTQIMIEVDRGKVPTATEEIETEGGTEETKGTQTTQRRRFQTQSNIT